MGILLEARTPDPRLLTGQDEMPFGAELDLGSGVGLRHLGTERFLDGSIPSLVTFAVTVAAGVGTGVVSSGLWDYLKHVAGKLGERVPGPHDSGPAPVASDHLQLKVK